MALSVNMNELKLNKNKAKQLKQALSDATKSYPNSNSAAYDAGCTFCSKIIHVDAIKMCIKCGHNICDSHAFITDSSNQFLTTFCRDCNPNQNNANDEKRDPDDLEISSADFISIGYKLFNDPFDYLLTEYPPTEMIAVLDYFLNGNDIENALIIITNFMKQCPNPSTQQIYKYNDNYGCCHRGKKTVNLLEYLFYYFWKIHSDYNFLYILAVIKAIEALEMNNRKKMKIIESLFVIILGFSCCDKNRFDDRIDHEMLAFEWIKECNKIYTECDENNTDNLLLIQNIECYYDVHFKRDNDELLILSPLKYIEQCSNKQRIYSTLFWGRTGYYPQQIVNYIDDQLNEEQKNDELKEEKNNDELLRSVDLAIMEEWKKLKCQIFDDLFEQLMILNRNRKNDMDDAEEIVYNMLFDAIIHCYDIVSTQHITIQNEYKHINVREMAISVGGMYLRNDYVETVGKVIWKNVLDAVKKKINENEWYNIGNIDLDYFIIKCCTILWNAINSKFVVYPLITECDDIIYNDSYQKQGENTGNIIKYVVFPALKKSNQSITKIWVMCNN